MTASATTDRAWAMKWKLVPVASVCFFSLSSCEKSVETASGPEASAAVAVESEAEIQARKDKFEGLVKEANERFRQRDISGALALLEDAAATGGLTLEFLNLRGACRVETRDFDAALADFLAAMELEPDNASIRFNVGEVHFVMKRWQEALDCFQGLGASMKSGELADLVDFKIALCHAGAGDEKEFQKRASDQSVLTDRPLGYFAAAAMDFQSGSQAGAREHLNQAKARFRNAEALAPWLDTMTEFGWAAR